MPAPRGDAVATTAAPPRKPVQTLGDYLRNSGGNTPTSACTSTIYLQPKSAHAQLQSLLCSSGVGAKTIKGNNPYIFVSAVDVPVSEHLRERLKERLRKYGFDNILESYRNGNSGYFVVFPDSSEGQDATSKCYRSCNGTPFWGYSLRMRKYDSGFSLLDIRKNHYKAETWQRSLPANTLEKGLDDVGKTVSSPYLPQMSSPLKITKSEGQVQQQKKTEKPDLENVALNNHLNRSSFGKRDTVTLNRRRLDEDDNRSLSSTSSLKRGTNCNMCNSAESPSYNPLVTCLCRRRYHAACHRPMIITGQQSNGSWRCYVCTTRPSSRTLQSSPDSSFRGPSAKRLKIDSPIYRKAVLIAEVSNGVAAQSPATRSLDKLSSSLARLDPVIKGYTPNTQGHSPQPDIFIKLEPGLSPLEASVPLVQRLPGTGVIGAIKNSQTSERYENASDSASMDISIDNDESTDLEACPSDNMPFEDSASMEISTSCDESTDQEIEKAIELGHLGNPNVAAPNLLDGLLVDQKSYDQAAQPFSGPDMSDEHSIADSGLRYHQKIIVIPSERHLPSSRESTASANVNRLVQSTMSRAEPGSIDILANLKLENQTLDITHSLPPALKGPGLYENVIVECKNVASDTPLSDPVNAGSSFHSPATSQSSLSSPPSEVDQRLDSPQIYEKPAGTYTQYITAAIEEAPAGHLSCHEICNSIMATYPFYAHHFSRSTLTNSVSATLSQRSEFIKNPRPEGDNRNGSLWSLNKTYPASTSANEPLSCSLSSTTRLSTSSVTVKVLPKTPNTRGPQSPDRIHDTPIVPAEYAVRDNSSSSVHIVVPARRQGELPEWTALASVPVVHEDDFDYRVGNTICVSTEDAEAYGLVREIRRFVGDEMMLAILWYYSEHECSKVNSSRKHRNEWPQGCSHILTNWLEIIRSSTVVRKVGGVELLCFHNSEKILDVKGRRIRDSISKSVSWTIAFDELIGQGDTFSTTSNVSSSQTINGQSNSSAKYKRSFSGIKQQSPNSDDEQTQKAKARTVFKNGTKGVSHVRLSLTKLESTYEPKISKQPSLSQTPRKMDKKVDKTTQTNSTSTSIDEVIRAETYQIAGRKRHREDEENEATLPSEMISDVAGKLHLHEQQASSPVLKSSLIGSLEAENALPLQGTVHSAETAQVWNDSDASREELLQEIAKLKLEKQKALEAALGWETTSTIRGPPIQWPKQARDTYEPPPPNSDHLQSQKKATFGRVQPTVLPGDPLLDDARLSATAARAMENDQQGDTSAVHSPDLVDLPGNLEPILHEGQLAFRARKLEGSNDKSDTVYVVKSEPVEHDWQFLRTSPRQ